MTQVFDIRQGERREYMILKHDGIKTRYAVMARNPDSWSKRWRRMMTSGLYYNHVLEFSTCHDAQCCIDSDVKERRGQAAGWVPVTCPNDGASNH